MNTAFHKITLFSISLCFALAVQATDISVRQEAISIDPVVEPKLKEFFIEHGIAFNELPAWRDRACLIDVTISLDRLIHAYTEESKEAQLFRVAQFLGENPNIYRESNPVFPHRSAETLGRQFRDCVRGLQQIAQKKGIPFFLDPKLFCSFVGISHLSHCADLMMFSFVQVSNFLEICLVLSEPELLTACELLDRDVRYYEFLERSRTALKEYVKKNPATRESIIDPDSMIGFSEDYIRDSLRMRGICNSYIFCILGKHPRRRSLFQLLLKHCESDLLPDEGGHDAAKMSSGSQLSCSC